MNVLEKLFQNKLEEIGKKIETKAPQKPFEIEINDNSDERKIPDLGTKFGIIYKNNSMLLADWLNKLSKKEREILTDFILTREAFRFYFDQEVGTHKEYERFSDIIIHVIATLWYLEQNNLKIENAPIVAIRGRADAFEEEEILKSLYWVYFLTNCIQYKLSAMNVYSISVLRVKEAKEEKKELFELAWDVMYWLKAHIPEKISNGLPFYIKKKRHYELIRELNHTEFKDASAVNIGKKLKRSHNVVNRDFKQIMDEYGIFWWPTINYLKLRLYPYFFRVNINEAEDKSYLVEKLKKNRYIRNLRECECKGGAFLVGWMVSPLIMYEELARYFEKLKRKEKIDDYFIKQIRRRKVTWTITNEEIEAKEENYSELFEKGQKKNLLTITVYDQKYDITDIEKKKEEIFHEDLLMFISSLLYHFIGKSHYIFMPMDLFYELCEKNEVDSTKTTEVTYYINQLDMRCRRLGMYEYGLNIRREGDFKKALYLEIKGTQEREEIAEVIKKLEITSEMEQMEFKKRIILIFPEVKHDSLFAKTITNLLESKEIEYQIHQLNYHRGLKVPLRFLYHEAFDFEQETWEINTDKNNF